MDAVDHAFAVEYNSVHSSFHHNRAVRGLAGLFAFFISPGYCDELDGSQVGWLYPVVLRMETVGQ